MPRIPFTPAMPEEVLRRAAGVKPPVKGRASPSMKDIEKAINDLETDILKESHGTCSDRASVKAKLGDGSNSLGKDEVGALIRIADEAEMQRRRKEKSAQEEKEFDEAIRHP